MIFTVNINNDRNGCVFRINSQIAKMLKTFQQNKMYK
jgi:hypothetical protein